MYKEMKKKDAEDDEECDHSGVNSEDIYKIMNETDNEDDECSKCMEPFTHVIDLTEYFGQNKLTLELCNHDAHVECHFKSISEQEPDTFPRC